MGKPKPRHKLIKCVLCNDLYCEPWTKETPTGYGHNPWPLKLKGRCCDLCNSTKVLPARIRKIYGEINNHR